MNVRQMQNVNPFVSQLGAHFLPKMGFGKQRSDAPSEKACRNGLCLLGVDDNDVIHVDRSTDIEGSLIRKQANARNKRLLIGDKCWRMRFPSEK